MARGEWIYGGGRVIGFSYKKTTLIICSINIVIALYVLRSLYASLYVKNDDVVKFTPYQIRQMEESIQIRRAKEPVELVKLVKKLSNELATEEPASELSRDVKQRITNEILEKLRNLDSSANATERLEVVERWRSEKLKEVKELMHARDKPNSTIFEREAGILAKALESDWAVLSEDIGLWLPVEVENVEHDDKPEGEEEPEEALPGRPVPPECHVELHTDYGGAAVRWGLTHPKESAADCCQSCLDQAKNAKPGENRCNIWVYCPSEYGCYSPDIYEHKYQECWLKYAEKPNPTFKDRYSESFRNAHPNVPMLVPWASGVVTV